MLELRDASKVYASGHGEVTALHPTTLALKPGEILGLLGPNGAGKSTLIRMLAFALPPSRGSIYHDGRDCLRLSGRDLLRLKRRIGYLAEDPFAYSLLTGREYLGFIGEIYGIPAPELRARIERYVELLDLGEAADRFVRSYSQGMLKKLALIAALINDQDILLLDEPTNALDPGMIVVVRELLVRKREEGAAILLSTHVLDVAERLADRVAILHEGRLRRVESPGPAAGPGEAPARSRLESLYFEVVGGAGGAHVES